MLPTAVERRLTLPFGLRLLPPCLRVLPPPILLDFRRLDHIPLQLDRIMHARRHMPTLLDRADVLGRGPPVHQLLAIFNGLSFFRGDGPELGRSVGFPDPHVTVVGR